MYYPTYEEHIALLKTYELQTKLTKAAYDQEVKDCQQADVRLAQITASKKPGAQSTQANWQKLARAVV